MPGPVPKRASQRRRRNTPKQGVVTAGSGSRAPRSVGFVKPHPLIASLWSALQSSVESQFYSAADWRRVQLELWYANEVMTSARTPGSHAWVAVQSGLNSLLVSPADKRRVGIELRAAKVDEDEAAADDAVNVLHARFGA